MYMRKLCRNAVYYLMAKSSVVVVMHKVVEDRVADVATGHLSTIWTASLENSDRLHENWIKVS